MLVIYGLLTRCYSREVSIYWLRTHEATRERIMLRHKVICGCCTICWKLKRNTRRHE